MTDKLACPEPLGRQRRVRVFEQGRDFPRIRNQFGKLSIRPLRSSAIFFGVSRISGRCIEQKAGSRFDISRGSDFHLQGQPAPRSAVVSFVVLHRKSGFTLPTVFSLNVVDASQPAAPRGSGGKPAESMNSRRFSVLLFLVFTRRLRRRIPVDHNLEVPRRLSKDFLCLARTNDRRSPSETTPPFRGVSTRLRMPGQSQKNVFVFVVDLQDFSLRFVLPDPSNQVGTHLEALAGRNHC